MHFNFLKYVKDMFDQVFLFYLVTCEIFIGKIVKLLIKDIKGV